MELEQTRDILQQAMDQQWLDNQRAVDANRILADQKTAYENEARGTYYSGLPTWQRAQNAVSAAESLNDVNSQYAQNKVKIWNSVQNALDQIASYNEAAAELGAGTTGLTAGLSRTMNMSGQPFFLNGKQYRYVNGRLQEVTQ